MKRWSPFGGAVLVTVLMLFYASFAEAEVSVPATLQAQLAAKIANYDENFATRAQGHTVIVVTYKPNDAESVQFARQLAASFADIGDVGGARTTVDVIEYRDAASLASTCRAHNAAMLFLSAGIERETAAIAAALKGGNVLTIGASGAHAEGGAVVGFDAEGGKTQIVVNVASAKSQNVKLRSSFLHLAKLVGKS